MSFYAQILGNLGSDAEEKEGNNSKFLSFNVAVTQRDKSTEWVRCTYNLYKESKLKELLKKGTKVFVVGSLSTNDYQGKKYLNLTAKEIKVLSYKKEAEEDTFVDPVEDFF